MEKSDTFETEGQLGFILIKYSDRFSVEHGTV